MDGDAREGMGGVTWVPKRSRCVCGAWNVGCGAWYVVRGAWNFYRDVGRKVLDERQRRLPPRG